MKTCPLCDKSWPSHHTSCPADGAILIDSRELDPGTIIRGKYRIQRLLGRGGMGAVYLAEHILLARPRALKFISGDLSQDPAFLRRFRREALAAIELRHPNVVEVVDLDQAEDGSPYIAMEFVDGPDLRHALVEAKESPNTEPSQHSYSAVYQGTTSVVPQGPQNEGGVLTPEGCFPVPRALAIARGTAQGLAAAHAKGIVHRDVKPENILLANPNTPEETPKLLDFGIAAVHETVTAVSRTRGLLLTPSYAAPEQWRGLPADQLDGRTDLYALGGLLYEMLTGQTAFHALNYEGWAWQHQNTPPPPPSALRPELANWQRLDALVLRLLAKDREDRPKDVAELVGLLDAVIYVPPPTARTPPCMRIMGLPAIPEAERPQDVCQSGSGPCPLLCSWLRRLPLEGYSDHSRPSQLRRLQCEQSRRPSTSQRSRAEPGAGFKSQAIRSGFERRTRKREATSGNSRRDPEHRNAAGHMRFGLQLGPRRRNGGQHRSWRLCQDEGRPRPARGRRCDRRWRRSGQASQRSQGRRPDGCKYRA